MKINYPVTADSSPIIVTLSRRNLADLLDRLDDAELNGRNVVSARRLDEDAGRMLIVLAEPDSEHYRDRECFGCGCGCDCGA